MGYYGKITPSTMVKLFGMFGVERRPAARLIAYIVGHIKSGDKLEGLEAEWLESWMSDNDYAPEESWRILTFQCSYGQVDSDVFGGNRQSSVNAMRNLLEAGVLTLIKKGVKGHGSLYLFEVLEEPLRLPEGVNEDSDSLTPAKGSISNRVDFCGNKVNDRRLYGQATSGIGSKQNNLNGDFSSIPILIQSNNPSYSEALKEKTIAGPTCPHCGSAATQLGAGLIECRRCNCARPIKS